MVRLHVLFAAAAVSAAGTSIRASDAADTTFLCLVNVPGSKAHDGGNNRQCDQIDHWEAPFIKILTSSVHSLRQLSYLRSYTARSGYRQ